MQPVIIPQSKHGARSSPARLIVLAENMLQTKSSKNEPQAPGNAAIKGTPLGLQWKVFIKLIFPFPLSLHPSCLFFSRGFKKRKLEWLRAFMKEEARNIYHTRVDSEGVLISNSKRLFRKIGNKYPAMIFLSACIAPRIFFFLFFLTWLFVRSQLWFFKMFWKILSLFIQFLQHDAWKRIRR